MLNVKTELRISPLHGLGVYAAEPIQKSQVVVRYHRDFDITFTPEQFQQLPAAFQEAVEYYGYLDSESGIQMYNVDNGRFINHSDEPNLKMGHRVMTALRDIAPGEEITANYKDFCDACKTDLGAVFANTRSFVDQESMKHLNPSAPALPC
jgi:uncharacterized protein